MPNQGLTLKHQTDALIDNIRGRQTRVKSTTPARVRMKLAEILPINGPAPLLDIAPDLHPCVGFDRVGYIKIILYADGCYPFSEWID